MAKKNTDKTRGQVSNVQFTQESYPEVIDGVNNLAALMDRKPHDAVRMFFEKTKAQMPQILKYCREELKIAI